MTLKSIDLQVALSRTHETTHIQNQMNHKPEQDQHMLAQAGIKHAEADRQRSAKVDDTAEPQVRYEQEQRGQGGKRERNGRHPQSGDDGKPGAEPIEAKHPFKGKHIDLSL